MLVIEALAALMGGLAIALGPVAAPVIAFCRGSWGPFRTREPAPAAVPEISRPVLA
jgi:hypothetical protein